MKDLERIVSFGYLRGVHLNDAKAGLGSHLDRHQSIGKGTLGLEPFRMIMNDERLEEVPMVLETIDETIWPEEIRLLKGMER